MRYSLRPYQKAAFETCIRDIRGGCTSMLLVAPTGAGKTVLGCAILEHLESLRVNALFLAHRTELIEQTSAKLSEIGLRHGVIKSGMDSGDFSMRIQVASVQTFCARLKSGRVPLHFGSIMTDEAHHRTASTYDQIVKANRSRQNVLEIGLTATAYRTDGTSLGDVYSKLTVVAEIADLVRDGYLVPLRVFEGRERPDLAGVRHVAGDYDEGELGQRMNRPRLTGHIVQEYIRLAWGRPAVCFAVNVAHSKAIVQAFNAAGIKAEHVDGKMPAGARADIRRRLDRGEISIVSNCGVYTEGFDCPRVSCIIAARPTKSRGLWRQCVGRGLRICPAIGKGDCLLLDHAGWTRDHGSILARDIVTLEGGLVKPKERGERTCPACEIPIVGSPETCPACGAKLGQGDAHPGLGDPGAELVESNLHSLRARPVVPRAPWKPQPIRYGRRVGRG